MKSVLQVSIDINILHEFVPKLVFPRLLGYISDDSHAYVHYYILT